MGYRPDNPYEDPARRMASDYERKSVRYDYRLRRIAFEEGVDAAYDGLKKKNPCYVNEEDVISINIPLGKAKGRLVFIPEEE